MRSTSIIVLFFVVLGFFATGTSDASGAPQTRFALLIGNEVYGPLVGPLKNPVNDINSMETSLKQLGFEVVKAPNLTRAKMTGAIKEHASKLSVAGSEALGLIYYSGHGLARPGIATNYLLPVEVTKMDDPDVWEQSIELDEITRTLKKSAPYNKHFLIIDACRTELMLRTKAPSIKGFERVSDVPGFYIVLSASTGQTASDWPDAENGPYAKVLSNEILVPGQTHEQLFQNVKLKVEALTSGAQNPTAINNLSATVYFAGGPKDVDSSAVSAPSSSDYAKRIWEFIIKAETDTKTLERFASDFSETPYAEKAKQRLQKIRNEKSASTETKNERVANHELDHGFPTPPEIWPQIKNEKSASIETKNERVANHELDHGFPTPPEIWPRRVALSAKSRWPTYQQGEAVEIEVKTNRKEGVAARGLFKFGDNEKEVSAVYDPKRSLFSISYVIPPSAPPGLYQVPVVVRDQSGLDKRLNVTIGVGRSRAEWTTAYLQPTPGQPAIIPKNSHAVVVGSPDDDYASAELRAFCRKYPDLDFSMYTSVDRTNNNARFQIEVAYNLSYEDANSIRDFAVKRGIGKKPYVMRYGWPSHTKDYYNCSNPPA